MDILGIGYARADWDYNINNNTFSNSPFKSKSRACLGKKRLLLFAVTLRGNLKMVPFYL